MIILYSASVLVPLVAGFAAKKASKAVQICLLCAEIAISAIIALLSGDGGVIWRFGEGLELMLGADRISSLFALLFSCVWLVAYVYTLGYMHAEDDRPRFVRYFMLTLSAMMLVAYSGNFFTLFVGFEAMTMLSMPMVIHERTAEARAAAMKYLSFSVFGAAAALFSFYMLSLHGTSTVFTPGGVLSEQAVAEHGNALRVIWLITVIGFGAKAGMFPLHSWLPTAHPVAPSPASAVLSGVITKCGVLAIIRVTFYLFGADLIRDTWAQYAAVCLSLLTVFMGSMMALGEKLIKKRLAYSTVSQVSYVLFGLMLMNAEGFEGAMLQAVFHILAKDALFMWAGAVIHETGLTRVDQLTDMGRRMPAAMWAFTIASLSLIGIPPTGGFVSKWALAQGALSSVIPKVGLIGVCVLIISAILTAGYLLPITASAFFPGKDAYLEPNPRREPSRNMLAPMLILAILTIVFGIFPNIVTGFIAPAVKALF